MSYNDSNSWDSLAEGSSGESSRQAAYDGSSSSSSTGGSGNHQYAWTGRSNPVEHNGWDPYATHSQYPYYHGNQPLYSGGWASASPSRQSRMRSSSSSLAGALGTTHSYQEPLPGDHFSDHPHLGHGSHTGGSQRTQPPVAFLSPSHVSENHADGHRPMSHPHHDNGETNSQPGSSTTTTDASRVDSPQQAAFPPSTSLKLPDPEVEFPANTFSPPTTASSAHIVPSGETDLPAHDDHAAASYSSSSSHAQNRVQTKLKAADLFSSYTCPICFSPPSFATMTPCGHVMCGDCLFTAVKTTMERASYHGPAAERAKCPVCRAPIPGWDGKGKGVIGLKPRMLPKGSSVPTS